ncbi:type II toxin-antitoxin system RelE/ParE family toxin [Chryseobacterium balustinum]|uniref:ParE toxin of type II toxin-antitoxin system, parDE n=1 Tax=Chryseobacterium balustinum TaxID=246 RepID=A0AAX2IIX0_9FLAO|nr:type II toxin-antitoxin system RelE/ParE family toxin [Chryseobacterium balustinum]AZB31623.1 type II toxin-antitoxin system RelE/ParE family toxin [Chryseobacterium balustinum]SKB81178.1 ParE toxin of type II toxin-antitoxin system, parDE [Chryseobacterium balustinum]SQA88380.1 Plasmid stabilisation system protein [Chryseobacterium balustinum]
MVYKLILKPEAENDLGEAIEYYQSKRKGLGLKFLKCVQKFFDRITKNPLHYPLKSNQFREAYIQKFPYIIIYEIIDNEIVVFSVFNTYQNPEKKP